MTTAMAKSPTAMKPSLDNTFIMARRFRWSRPTRSNEVLCMCVFLFCFLHHFSIWVGCFFSLIVLPHHVGSSGFLLFLLEYPCTLHFYHSLFAVEFYVLCMSVSVYNTYMYIGTVCFFVRFLMLLLACMCCLPCIASRMCHTP